MNDRHTREADMKTNIVRLLAENAELKRERDEAREQRDRLAEACSPSFDTTETDAAWSAHCIDPDSASGDPWDLAKKLETELTAVTEQLKQALEELTESQKDYKCLAELLNGHDATECRMNLVNLKQDIKTVTEQRDKYRDIASELIAIIRINVMRDTFKIATIEQVDEHLKPWIERIAAVKGRSDEIPR